MTPIPAERTATGFALLVAILTLTACSGYLRPSDPQSPPGLQVANNPHPQQPSNNPQAELVLKNAVIYAEPTAQAVAIADGVIQFVGRDTEVDGWIGTHTKVIDLNGQLLLPGFIDNHIHLMEGAETNCELKNGPALARQKALLEVCAASVPRGQWVIGYGTWLEDVIWDGNQFSNPRQLLDKVIPDHPVIIMETSSHVQYVNSRALQLAGFRDDSPDPAGGKLLRDEQGQLNGILLDNAGDIVMELAVNSATNRDEVLYEGVLFGLAEAKRHGITTIGDGRTYWRRGMYEALKRAERNSELTLRVSMRPWIYPDLPAQDQTPFLASAYQNDTSRRLIVNQAKLYVDGIPETGTARVIKPYHDTLLPEFPHGINYISEPEMSEWLIRLDELGYGAHIHATGDLGVREALNAIAAARANGSQRRYAITHLSMMDRADIARFQALDVDADIQLWRAASPKQRMRELLPVIDSQRATDLLYRPINELHTAGANVVLSSDWSVNPMSPLEAIAKSVQEGSWDIHSAIDSYTINAARALGLDQLTGSIAIGKSADLVVLDRDITALAADKITRAEFAMTVFQGRIVHSNSKVD